MTHVPARTLFDNLERAVIALGKRDPLISNMGPRARTIARLFGITAPNALAAPRLEALRLLVIALRRRDRHPGVEVAAALGSGFSQDQINCLATEMAAVELRPSALVALNLDRTSCSATWRSPQPASSFMVPDVPHRKVAVRSGRQGRPGAQRHPALPHQKSIEADALKVRGAPCCKSGRKLSNADAQ